MAVEDEVISHYGRTGLERTILDGIAALGRPAGALTIDDLAAVDEFHMGGRKATAELAGRLGLGAGDRVLDLGSGIGGLARFLAVQHGCRVTGIDLTPDYVAVATTLTAMLGLSDRVTFGQGSATAPPVEDGAFDAATLLHVGMNIPDKAALAAAAARALRPGGRFAVYDVMRTAPGAIAYPVAWAAGAETSFLATPAEYRAHLESAGFAVESERAQTALASEMFARMRSRLAAGPMPLGLHLFMGADAPVKLANMVANLQAGLIAPVEMIARKP